MNQWSMTSTGCGICSAILFCSDARAQLPLRLVPRPQNMQNGQKWPILLGLCPNHIFCSWGPIMLEILPAECVKPYSWWKVKCSSFNIKNGSIHKNRKWLSWDCENYIFAQLADWLCICLKRRKDFETTIQILDRLLLQNMAWIKKEGFN